MKESPALLLSSLLRRSRRLSRTEDEFRVVETIGVIADDERFDKVDAREALDLLDDRGHIYTVGETIRVTPTDM